MIRKSSASARAWPMVILMLLALGLPLAACGKKGEPGPPPGTPNTYPRTYPSG